MKEKIFIKGYILECNYDAIVPNPANGQWDFSIGKSAGVCVEDGQFFIADTSDLQQPFSDAFVTFHISKDGFEGSNVVPYLPQQWFDATTYGERANFSRIWFKNFINGGGGPPPQAQSHNYFHIIGASAMTDTSGLTLSSYDYTYCLVLSDEIECGAQADNCKRNTLDHEIAHQFDTNSCTNLQDCNDPLRYHGSHDYREWWLYGGSANCNSPDPCLMHPNGGTPTDSINRFCKEDLILGDPNCGGQGGEGSIRQREDPQ